MCKLAHLLAAWPPGWPADSRRARGERASGQVHPELSATLAGQERSGEERRWTRNRCRSLARRPPDAALGESESKSKQAAAGALSHERRLIRETISRPLAKTMSPLALIRPAGRVGGRAGGLR